MLSQTYDRLEPMVLQFFNSTFNRQKDQRTVKRKRGWTGSARGRERKRDRTESD